MDNLSRFFDPKNYVLEEVPPRGSNLWSLTTTLDFKLNNGETGFQFTMKRDQLVAFMELLEQCNRIEYSPTVDHVGTVIFSKYADDVDIPRYIGQVYVEFWKSLKTFSGSVPRDQYGGFSKLIKTLYERIPMPLKELSQEEKERYNPDCYILQCDYEDDCFMVFSESKYENQWGEEGVSIALSEEDYKQILDIFDRESVRSIKFEETDSHLGTGVLTITGSLRNHTPLTYVFNVDDAFRDVGGYTHVTDKERIGLINELLHTLYEKEFPGKRSKTTSENSWTGRGVITDAKSTNEVGVSTIDTLTILKAGLTWLEDKYGEDWGYLKKQSCQVMTVIIEDAINKEKRRHYQ